MTGGSSSSSDEPRGAWDAVSLVLRIATVGLSLASAITTATSTQCLSDNAGRPAGTVSYRDYPSLSYAAVADVLSAVLQGAAICLEATGRKKAAKFVELIDKLVLALTSTSTALLLAVDEVTSCGPPRRRGRGRGRSACDVAGAFCGRVRAAGLLSLASTVSVSASIYTARRRAPATTPPSSTSTSETSSTTLPSPPPEPSTPSSSSRCPSSGSGGNTPLPPPSGCCKDLVLEGTLHYRPPPPPPPPCTDFAPPPWCRCPRMTVPCHCVNPDPCRAFSF